MACRRNWLNFDFNECLPDSRSPSFGKRPFTCWENDRQHKRRDITWTR
jgi:hypothetical protein